MRDVYLGRSVIWHFTPAWDECVFLVCFLFRCSSAPSVFSFVPFIRDQRWTPPLPSFDFIRFLCVNLSLLSGVSIRCLYLVLSLSFSVSLFSLFNPPLAFFFPCSRDVSLPLLLRGLLPLPSLSHQERIWLNPLKRFSRWCAVVPATAMWIYYYYQHQRWIHRGRRRSWWSRAAFNAFIPWLMTTRALALSYWRKRSGLKSISRESADIRPFARDKRSRFQEDCTACWTKGFYIGRSCTENPPGLQRDPPLVIIAEYEARILLS